MNAILAKYLKDFSVPDTPAPVGSGSDMLDGDDFGFPMFEEPSEPPVDIEALCDAARREGYEAAREEMEARHETEIGTLNAVHSGELDDLRNLFEQQFVKLVEDRFAAVRQDVISRMSDQMAHLLAPVLGKAVLDRTVAELATAIGEALNGKDAGRVIIRGPLDFTVPLAAQLGARNIAHDVVEADMLDVQVEIGESAIVSRMSAWLDGLAEVLS